MSKKEEIIKIVSAMEKQIGTDVMGQLFEAENKGKSDKKIGSNQFRDIASMCAKAETYSEIELMIKYSIAKIDGDKSWKKICSNKKTFGTIILDAMEKVKALDESNILSNMELFFGYLYWQVRIWADLYGETSDNKPHNKPADNRTSKQFGNNNCGKRR